MDNLNETLLKKALGYMAEEVVEEYGNTEEGLELTKKKITTKHIPPDLAALKAYMELSRDELTNMSVDELKKEKKRLLMELKKQKDV